MLTLRYRPVPPRLRLRYRIGGETAVAQQPQSLPSIATVIGPRGPRGVSGAGGARYLHTQSSPSAMWTVNHNLGDQPAGVVVLSPGGVEVIADIIHVSVNQLRVAFAIPAMGRVSII